MKQFISLLILIGFINACKDYQSDVSPKPPVDNAHGRYNHDTTTFPVKYDDVVDEIHKVLSDPKIVECGTDASHPDSNCNILEYLFVLPPKITDAREWYLFKGYDNLADEVCYILAVENMDSTGALQYRYFKGKVYCPKICGVDASGALVLTALADDLKRSADDTPLVELGGYDEAAAYVNGHQLSTLMNEVPVPASILRWAGVDPTGGTDLPVYFRMFYTEKSPGDAYFIFDVLNKEGERYGSKVVNFLGMHASAAIRGRVDLIH